MKRLVCTCAVLACALGVAQADTEWATLSAGDQVTDVVTNRGAANDGTRYFACPPGTIWGQESHECTDDWSAATSAVADWGVPGGVDYIVYENFSYGMGETCDVHWWGLCLRYDNGWYLCDPPADWLFEITFYYDDGTGMPDTQNPACSYVVNPTITVVDPECSGAYILYQFDADLDPCCPLNNGWISIQSLPNANDCGFLWMSSDQGDMDSLQEDRINGDPPASTGYDRGVCLTGELGQSMFGATQFGGMFEGWGNGYNGEWYFYPNFGWWNMWWPNEFDLDRRKAVHLEFDVNVQDAGFLIVVVNWATPEWEALGLDRPPLPEDVPDPETEELYIGRHEVAFYGPGQEYAVIDLLLDYCPSWISIDIMGEEYFIEGWLDHQCIEWGPDDFFYVDVDMGGFAEGGGSGYNFGEWYYYDQTNWWNIWFENEFDLFRVKEIDTHMMLEVDPGGYALIALNWAMPEWTALGMNRPPLPEDFWQDPSLEDVYIAREPFFEISEPGTYPIDWLFQIPFCPEWISMDVQGYGFRILDGTIRHECRCIVDCQEGSIPEGEPPIGDEYVDMYNGGCNSDPTIFQPIACGDVICGESATYLFEGQNYRDTDWYELVLNEPMIITWKAIAEFPLQIVIIDASTGCDPITVVDITTAPPCEMAALTSECLPPGVYWLWAGPNVFQGVPPGSNYVAQVTCHPCAADVNTGFFGGWMNNYMGMFPAGLNDGYIDPDMERGPWFYYEDDYPTLWWNAWWPNPYNLDWLKDVRLTFDLMTWNDGWAMVTVNWSNENWMEPEFPPLPEFEDFVDRAEPEVFYVDGTGYQFLHEIPFCPAWVSVDVWGSRFFIEGQIEHICHAHPSPGDMDCDGDVDFDDIGPFVLAIQSQAAYESVYWWCDWMNADCDGDGDVDFDDINPFVGLIGS